MQKLHSSSILSLSTQIFTGPDLESLHSAQIAFPGAATSHQPAWSQTLPVPPAAATQLCSHPATATRSVCGHFQGSFPHPGKSPSDPKECQEDPKSQGSVPPCSCLAQHTIPYNILSSCGQVHPFPSLLKAWENLWVVTAFDLYFPCKPLRFWK